MKRTILVAFDVDDVAPDMPTEPALAAEVAVSDADLEAGVRARLDEFYPEDGIAYPIENVRVAVSDPDAVRTLLASADVGLEGAGDWHDDLDVIHAQQALDALRGPELAVDDEPGPCPSMYNGQPCALTAPHPKRLHRTLRGAWEWDDAHADPPKEDTDG